MAIEKSNVWEVDPSDMAAVKRAFRRLDKEGSKALRAAVQKVTERHAAAIRSAGTATGDPRTASIANTVRAAKDRFPVVNIGGAKRMPHRGNPRSGDVVFGTEFGSSDWRFPARNSPNGYWIYPTLRTRQSEIVRDWQKTVDDVMKLWGDT